MLVFRTNSDLAVRRGGSSAPGWAGDRAYLFHYNKHPRPMSIGAVGNCRSASKPDLLQASDIVSLHLPLTEETHHLIGEPEPAMMPRESFLINTARGGLVDEAALRRAITSGHLGGAGLNVIDDELAGRNPFVDLPQVLVTLHLGGASRGSVARMVERSSVNTRRFLAGEAVRDLVPGLKGPRCSGLPLPSSATGLGSSSAP